MARNKVNSFWPTYLEGNHTARDFYEARGWRVESKIVMKTETPEGLCIVGAWKMMKPSQKPNSLNRLR